MLDIEVISGDTWQRAWIITHKVSGLPVDLTGAVISLQVQDLSGVVKATASLLDGRLTVNIATGRIDLIMPHAAMVLSPGKYPFGLQAVLASGVKRTYESEQLHVNEDPVI